LWQFILPLIFSVVLTVAFLLIPYPPLLLTKDGLIASNLSVISTLPGFYFAGLAAVATFNGLNMDAVMASPSPKVRTIVGGAAVDVDLSRRQFLSYLFSYLVIISFMICAISLGALAGTNSIYKLHVAIVAMGSDTLWNWIRGGSLAIYITLCCSMVVTSLHGMFFLTERIHQP
jgi:hypothetical protein